MSDLDGSLLRKLAEWDGAGVPVTTVSMSVDGRRFPRPQDVQVRLDELLRAARAQAEGLPRDAARSVERDLDAMAEFVRDEFDRGDTRGLAMFSCHAAGLWEVVTLPRPIRDRALVGLEPDLLPLEIVLETYRSTCVVLVDHADARLFFVELGRIEETAAVNDDVPGRHDQGGWAQMRMQRHVDDHRSRHVRRVADRLLALFRRRPFEHLILAGPGDAQHELGSVLHDYLVQRVRRNLTLSMTASGGEVLDHVNAIAQDLEREAEREAVARLHAATAAGANGVTGLAESLRALSEGRVGELVVAHDLSAPGARCTACGRLTEGDPRCPSCGAVTVELTDVVGSALTQALRTGARVETIEDEDALRSFGGIGAMLRY